MPLRRAPYPLAVLALIAAPLSAQTDPATALAGWVGLDAPIAHEQLATDRILAAMPGWARDRTGSLVLTRGRGAPRRVVACGIDRPNYAVTQITSDGYLRLHRVGSIARHPLWDQGHEGQQVVVHTAGGPVPGVVAIANGHFAQQHRGDTTVVTADQLWVDVGATSAADVAGMGIGLMDPVTRRVPGWAFEGHVAGADAGARAGCAALAAAAAGEPGVGETTFVIAAQTSFGWVGVGAAVAALGRVDRLTILDRGRATGGPRTVAATTLGNLGPVLAAAGLDSVRFVAPTVRHAGSLLETIALDEADRLLASATEAAGIAAATRPAWVAIAPVATPVPARDSLADNAVLLEALADLPAVPTHEWRVRDAIRAALPEWARALAQVDRAGNLWLALGPDRDTTVFMAHMDEVAYEVTTIAPDGTVGLAARGGTVNSAWEGQPALLHFDPAEGGTTADASIPGIFPMRDQPRVKNPGPMTAWFGMDSTALAARGVRPGLGVTAYKDATRIGASRLTARALDDRVGSTALILALRRIDPARLPAKVVFAWSTQEEGGLVGAAAMARTLRTSVTRIYSVDTFVSSDTPLETPHFAHTPLGSGPVLRSIESASIVPLAERRRVLDAARSAGIPLQQGMAQGSTDGTTFTFWGVPNIPLSWPGRYSHTPGEVMDLRDLSRLATLVVTLANTPN